MTNKEFEDRSEALYDRIVQAIDGEEAGIVMNVMIQVVSNVLQDFCPGKTVQDVTKHLESLAEAATIQ